MRNKILFIGVGGAGSIMADKAMRDYPELFDSVAIDCGINRELSCHQLSLMDRHPYGESAGFTTQKENVESLINENINERPPVRRKIRMFPAWTLRVQQNTWLLLA